MIGLGFVGLGWLGESLIKDLPRVPGLALAAVQDTRADHAAAIAGRYGSPWHGQRFEDLLAQPTVAAVAISTPNGLHAQQAQQALRAGRHVLVQKPLALSAADADATVALARETGKLLFVDYTYRFLATMASFRAAAGADTGGIRRLTAAFHNVYGPGNDKAWFFDPRLSGGGALTDLGVHLLDLALWLCQPSRARLLSAELHGAPIEHAATLRLELDSAPFELSVSWQAPWPQTEILLELESTNGTRVRWENVDGSFFRFRSLRDGQVLAEQETSLREDTLRAFRAALLEGQTPPIDARVYALLDQAYGRSARPRRATRRTSPGRSTDRSIRRGST